MASAAPTIALERTAKIALVEESTEDSIETHAAGDFIRHAGAAIQLPFATQVHEDLDGTATANGRTKMKNQSIFSFPDVPVRPSGSSGGAAEMDPLLKGLMGTSAAPGDTTVNDAAGTVNDCTLADGSNLSVGDIIYFVTTGEATVVKTVSGNDITYDPPLSTAPTNTETVVIGKQFRYAADTPTFTAVWDNDNMQWAATGVTVNEASFAFSQNDVIRASFGGHGSGKRSFAGTTTLLSNTTATNTTTAVAAGHGAKFRVTDGSLRVTLGVGTANEEVVTVTGVSGDTLTHTATTNNHTAGDEIQPYFLTPTKTGVPIPGTAGEVVVSIVHNGTTIRFPGRIISANFNRNNGYVRDSDFGNDHDNVRYRQGPRPVESGFEIVCRMDQASAGFFGQAQNDVQAGIVAWGGDTTGSIFAVGGLNAYLEPVEVSAGAGDQKTVTLRGRFHEETAGQNDDLRVAFL